MVQLGDYISVRGRFARSANLERDLARQEPLEGYVATARALTVPRAHRFDRGEGAGRWCLVGDRALRIW